MTDFQKKSGRSTSKIEGLTLNCNECKEELPLLHPHIILERSDAEGNPICESCWREREEKKKSEP